MGLFGGGGDQKVEQKAPDWLRPQLFNYGNLLAQELAPGGQLGANAPMGPSPLTQRGIDLYGQTGPYDLASQYQQNVLGGQYLGLSPQFQQAVMDPAIANVAGRFAQAGRYGSPASQEAMAEAGMRALAPYYGQERGYQQQASVMLPALQAQQAGQFTTGGALQEYWQNPMLNYLTRVQPLMGGGGYGVTTQNQPGGGWQGALGGAAGGAMMGAQFGPWGMAGGALLGGLMSI